MLCIVGCAALRESATKAGTDTCRMQAQYLIFASSTVAMMISPGWPVYCKHMVSIESFVPAFYQCPSSLPNRWSCGTFELQ